MTKREKTVTEELRDAIEKMEHVTAEVTEMTAALQVIAGWDQVPITNEHREGLLSVVRAICDRARDALSKSGGPRAKDVQDAVERALSKVAIARCEALAHIEDL